MNLVSTAMTLILSEMEQIVTHDVLRFQPHVRCSVITTMSSAKQCHMIRKEGNAIASKVKSIVVVVASSRMN
jgi:hypothetical protein